MHEIALILPGFCSTQEHFDGVMREYPDSSKAMDLIAEHRLRALRSNDAWLAKHGAHPATAPSAASLGSKIEHVLEVRAPDLAGVEGWFHAPWFLGYLRVDGTNK